MRNAPIIRNNILRIGMCHVLTVFTFTESVSSLHCFNVYEQQVVGKVCISIHRGICQACHPG